jgi:invasion protein IalB
MLRRFAFLGPVLLMAALTGSRPAYAQDAAAPDASADSAGAPPEPETTQQAKPRPKPKPKAPAPKPAAHSETGAPAGLALPASWPNGASSLTEVYGDWTMTCSTPNNTRTCNLSQTQGNKETGQRIFAIELHAPHDGRVEGTLLLPLGLKFESGVLIKVGDKNIGQGLHFTTCLAQGCLFALTLPAADVDAMKKADKVTVAALNLGNAQPVTFTVATAGFAAALDRVAVLDH